MAVCGAIASWSPARTGVRGRTPREQGELFDHMLDAIDAERETLAHCLHDGPQQTLTAVRLMCDVVRDAISKGDVHHAEEVLGRLERLASDAADDLRRTVARLHPVVMQQQGLVQALGSLAETVHEEYGVTTTFNRPRGGWEAEEDRDTAIFQIAREAAVNAARARAAAGPDQPAALAGRHPPERRGPRRGAQRQRARPARGRRHTHDARAGRPHRRGAHPRVGPRNPHRRLAPRAAAGL